jgi:hypothetical protein
MVRRHPRSVVTRDERRFESAVRGVGAELKHKASADAQNLAMAL